MCDLSKYFSKQEVPMANSVLSHTKIMSKLLAVTCILKACAGNGLEAPYSYQFGIIKQLSPFILNQGRFDL